VSISTRWDKHRVFESVKALPAQLEHAWESAQTVPVPTAYRQVNQVLMCGMGGSLLGARVIESVFGSALKLPLVLVNDYQLPGWVNQSTLVICSSYSGSTEETLANFRQAQASGAKIMVITAGGQLLALSRQHRLPYYQIIPQYNPANQPRLAIGYFETNRRRMDYPSYRRRRMHIGSGVVEAACKHVVGARCKRAGMRWTATGAETVLALRTQLLNDRWDEYWQPKKAAA